MERCRKETYFLFPAEGPLQNEVDLRRLDYVVAKAKQANVKIILAMANFWAGATVPLAASNYFVLLPAFVNSFCPTSLIPDWLFI